MSNNIPLAEALQKFDEAGYLQDVVQLIELVSQDRFPLHNITFRLAMDVVRFYGQSTTTNMTYNEESKYWWRTGWRIFGEKFLRLHSALALVGKRAYVTFSFILRLTLQMKHIDFLYLMVYTLSELVIRCP